jgi:SAM-dependent methyltransferase
MDAAGEAYSQRGNAAFEAHLAERTATAAAAFLIPHLNPSMRLLDVGCGPGSITVGLADVVAGGEVVGVDLQDEPLNQARARAARRGAANVSFERADLYRLPFPDASFDAAFANGVLTHLDDAMRALAEIRRVLRPGGVLGMRDPDFGATLFSPCPPLLERWFAVRVKVRQHNAGDPFSGRHARRLLLESGFSRARAGASVASAGALDETRRHGDFLKAQLRGFAPAAIANEWMDAPTLDAVSAEIDAWAVRRDAFSATVWCEALGWVDDLAGR